MTRLSHFISIFIIILSTNNLFAFESVIEEELTTPWEGFGYNQWGYARESDGNTFKPWTDELWDITAQRILAIRPSAVRLPLLREWFNTDDNDQPLPIGTYNWDSKYMQAFYKTMDFYKEHDIKVMSGLWGVNLRSVPIEDPNAFYQSDEAIQLHTDLINHLVNVKGYGSIITTYAPTNEPLGAEMPFEVWSNMCKKLYAALQQKGLPTNIISGADSWGGWIWLPAQQNKDQLSAYDFHHYLNQTPKDTNDQLYNRLIESNFTEYLANIAAADNSNKPVYVSEMAPMGTPYIDKPVDDAPIHCQIDSYEYALGFWDYGIQLARSGISSGLAWGLDGFEWGKNAGMWNNSGAHGGMTLRPWYYTWQLMCRYFPRNAKILKMSELEDSNDLRIVGARIGVNDYTFVIVNRRTNTNSQTRTVTINVDCPQQTIYIYRFNRTNTGDGVSLSLPYETSHNSFQETAIEIPMEEGVLLTTLPPLDPIEKEETNTLSLDFEQETNEYMLVTNSLKRTTTNYATNPRKKEPNTSSNVCMVETQLDNIDERDSYGSIFFNKNISIGDSQYLNFQLYKNRSETVAIGLHITGEEGLWGNEFELSGRQWTTLQLDLSSLSGKAIDYIAVYPKRSDELSLTETESVSIDNIELTATRGNPTPLVEIQPYSNQSYRQYLDIGFEYIDPSVVLSTTDHIFANIEGNPKIQDVNNSQYVCKIESQPNLTGQAVELQLFPAVAIPIHKNALSFKYYNNRGDQHIKIILKFLSDKTFEKELSITEKRLWQTLFIDLESYKDEIISSIVIIPDNVTGSEESEINYSYFDDFTFTSHDFSAIDNIQDTKPVVYHSNGIVYITDKKSNPIMIYSFDGKLMGIKHSINGTISFPIDRGAYIIRMNNFSYKIIY